MKKILAGNWKMNKTLTESLSFLQDLKLLPSCDVRIIPPYLSIPLMSHDAKKTGKQKFLLGAQNMSEYETGAHTGEISIEMLMDVGVDFILIGHSERRNIFGETDEVVHKKVRKAFECKMPFLLCVGETEHERDALKTKSVLHRQILSAFGTLPEEELKNLCTIAYEPVWAIGTGNTATPAMVNETHQLIHKIISENYSKDLSQAIPILYGGSVNAKNIQSICEQVEIDGALVGGASLDVNQFNSMIEILNELIFEEI